MDQSRAKYFFPNAFEKKEKEKDKEKGKEKKNDVVNSLQNKWTFEDKIKMVKIRIVKMENQIQNAKYIRSCISLLAC